MAEFNLLINEQERAELLRLLRSSLGETRVEVHRTHTPGYRESVKHEEEVIRGLLQKIEGSPHRAQPHKVAPDKPSLFPNSQNQRRWRMNWDQVKANGNN